MLPPELIVTIEQIGEAIAAFNEFTETHRQLGNPARMGQGLDLLGHIHERQGHYRAALEKFQQALALLQQYGSLQEVAVVENDIARIQESMKGEG